MKKLKKFMAALLVAFMALAVIPAGAFAEDVTGTFTPDVTKVVSGDNVSFPQTFKFTLSLEETAQVGSFTPSALPENYQKVVTAEVNKDEETGKAESTVNFDAIILNPGIYKFAITETENSAFVTSPANTIYAYVAVNNEGIASIDYSTSNVGLNSVENGTITVTGKEDKATFTNTVSTGNNFSFVKEVTGTASNPTDTFDITINVAFPEGYENSTATVTCGSSSKTLTATDSSVKFEGIQDGSTITSTAMPKGTIVTITEGQNAYTQEWSISDNGSFNVGGTDLSKSITINADTQVVTLNNNRTATTITGFVMHYTPYIALIVVAGVAVALIAKRRNHSEF